MSLADSIKRQKDARENFIRGLDTSSLDFRLATWFGSGLIVPAPGTWGTLGGMIFGLPLLLLTNSLVTFVVALILLFVGVRSVERIESKLGDHDASFIVIDEVVAILMVLALLPSSNWIASALAGFVLFRFFDARKPWLIGMADQKISGAWGVMVDDLLAAVFSVLAFYCVYIPFVMWG